MARAGSSRSTGMPKRSASVAETRSALKSGQRRRLQGGQGGRSPVPGSDLSLPRPGSAPRRRRSGPAHSRMGQRSSRGFVADHPLAKWRLGSGWCPHESPNSHGQLPRHDAAEHAATAKPPRESCFPTLDPLLSLKTRAARDILGGPFAYDGGAPSGRA